MSEPVSESAQFPGNWEKYGITARIPGLISRDLCHNTGKIQGNSPDPPYERS